MRWWVCRALGCVFAAGCVPRADLIVHGSLVDGVDQAVVVRGDRIVAVVPPESAARFRRGATEHLTAPFVSAGVVDAHAHPYGVGRRLAELDLTGLATYAEVLEAIAAVPGDDWILGRGWDQNDWSDVPEGGWPLAADLEAIQPGRKVRLRRVDGHAVWVSFAALRGVELPEVIEGGRVVRDVDGQPTGVLTDLAMDRVPGPRSDSEVVTEYLRVGLAEFASQGVTGVHAMGVSDATLDGLMALDRRGALPIRVWVYLVPEAAATRRLLAAGPWQGDRVSVVGIKAFADGALGSRGALLSEPYTDEPGHSGSSLVSADELEELAIGVLKVRAQLAVHAIGDAAVSRVLDVAEAARRAVPEASDVPLRIEHAQITRPEDWARMRAAGVVASMQPVHATSDMPWAPQRLGNERVEWAYSWRRALSAEVPLAFGSDAPVEYVDLEAWMWAATTRTDATGMPSGGWIADQRLTAKEAMSAFTEGAASALGEGERRGLLERGYPADLTLWRSEATEYGTRWWPIGTIVDGELVWSKAPVSSN